VRTAPLSSAEAAAAAAVDEARLVADLRALIRTPSVTGSEEAVQSLVAELAADVGLAVERVETDPSAIAADPGYPGAEMPRGALPVVIGRTGRPGGRRLLLVAHVDVVPINDPGAWTVPPWEGLVRDGHLYGRGACDMKGGLAAILGAFRAVRDAGIELSHGEAWLVAVPSEEDGGQGMLAAIRAGATGDGAIITEPSGLELVVAHAGALTFRLTVPGRAAHASQRREGVSALDKLMVIVAALERDEERRNAAETHPLMTPIGLPYPTIVGKVSGGEWASTVVDRVVADGRYGVRLGQTAREAEADLRAAVAAACAAAEFLRDHPASVEFTGGRFSSAQVPADHPLPEGLSAVAGALTGRAPARIGVPYGADMALLVNEGGTPTVIFGPGDVRVAHAADEHVPLEEVADCARVLAAWLVRELA
jgi:acetylornithine deacetylase